MPITFHTRLFMRIAMFFVTLFLLLDLIDRYDGVDTNQSLIGLGVGIIFTILLFFLFFARKNVDTGGEMDIATTTTSTSNSLFNSSIFDMP